MPHRARKLLSLLIVLFAALGAAAPARAQSFKPRVQRTVTVGFYVFNVRDLDMRGQRFAADFYLWMRYRGEMDRAEMEAFERLEFHNGRIEAREELEREDKPDEHYVCWRISGTFQTRFTLENYPLDTQRLDIVIEHPALEFDQLVFAHDEASYRRSPAPSERWGIKNGLDVPDFRVVGTDRRVDTYTYETDFGHIETATLGTRYSRLTLGIRVQRIFSPYFYKLVVPFLVMLACAYLAFWVPPSEITASVVLTLLALLSTIAFQMTVARDRPDTGYLILADKFFIATLVLIFAALVQSMATYNLERAGQVETALKLDVAARVVFPIAFGSAFAFLLFTALKAGG